MSERSNPGAQSPFDELLRFAKEATNGWACYAKRNIEHDEIARLHRDIATIESLVRSSVPVRASGAQELSAEQAQSLAWAVSNCHTLARREIRRLNEAGYAGGSLSIERWEHVQRITEKAGARSKGVLRASLPTEITEGSGNEQAWADLAADGGLPESQGPAVRASGEPQKVQWDGDMCGSPTACLQGCGCVLGQYGRRLFACTDHAAASPSDDGARQPQEPSVPVQPEAGEWRESTLRSALTDCLDVIQPLRDELRKQGRDDAATCCDEVIAYSREALTGKETTVNKYDEGWGAGYIEGRARMRKELELEALRSASLRETAPAETTEWRCKTCMMSGTEERCASCGGPMAQLPAIASSPAPPETQL